MQLNDSINRLGTETAFQVLARADALSRAGRDIINLGIGQPDFKTADHIVEAAVQAMRDGHHGYTPAQGILPLREAVSRDMADRHHASIDPDRIVIMPGGKPTMFFAMLLFGGAGSEILYPDPGFPIYRSMIEYAGAKPVPIKLSEANTFAFNAEEVLAQITPRTRLLIINSPGNPTGGVVPASELEALSAGLERHPHVAVLSDEIYSRMVYDGQPYCSMLSFPALRDRLIVLDGWSKTFAMTGWRLGFSIWPESLVDPVVRLAVNSFSCVNAPTQYAGIAALDGPQDAVAEMMTAFDARRALIVDLINALPGVSCITPGGAFYAFANVTRTGRSSSELQTAFLEEAGVATIAGPSFGIHGEGYVRFSYANDADNIRRAMARIGEVL